MHRPSRLVGGCLLALSLLFPAGCSGGRAVIPSEELYRRLDQAEAANLELVQTLRARVVPALADDLAAGREPAIDILSLSGGGDWGAYGAGFLRAWSEIPKDDPRAMPEFDMVNGISTGALIAPYAFLGLFERVDELYRNSSTDWAREHIFYGLVSGNSLYDITDLEERIRDEISSTIAAALRAQRAEHRSLVVATADLDLGILRLWDLLKAADDPARLYQIQRAAIAIPAAFEPVVIDDTLQADAGVLMQLIAVGRLQGLVDVLQEWNAAHPATPARLRHWVVVNNRTHEPPTTVQPNWRGSLMRSSTMMLKAGVIAPLKNLALRTQVLRSQGLEAEFRWTAIPPDFPIDSGLNPFDPRTTRALSDLGRRIALSATPWHDHAPLYLQQEVHSGDHLE